MRYWIILMFVLLANLGSAQTRPNNFTELASVDSTNFEIYSQKGDSSRRVNAWTAKKYMAPFVGGTLSSVAATGNTDSLTQFVTDALGNKYYIDGNGKSILLQTASGGSEVRSSFFSLTIGNSTSQGVEDSTDIGYEIVDNLYSLKNGAPGTDWVWEVAVPDTNLVGANGYTNIPYYFMNLGAQVNPRHTNPTHSGLVEFAKKNPDTDFYMSSWGRGGTLLAALTSTYVDSLGIFIDSLQANGVTKLDLVVIGSTAQEKPDSIHFWYDDLYQYLDGAGIIDTQKTVFLIQTSPTHLELNGAIIGYCRGKPNWRPVIGMANMPSGDGIHYTAQTNRDAGELLYQVLNGRANQSAAIIDTLGNVFLGQSVLTDGTVDNFTMIQTKQSNDIDSLTRNHIIATDLAVDLTNWVRDNNINVVSDGRSIGLNNNSKEVFYGFNVMYKGGVLRDSMTLVGRWVNSNKSDVVGVGNLVDIQHVGSDVFGAYRTTTRNNQLMLGRATTDYIFLGNQEFEGMIDSLTSANENWVFAWNNATRTWLAQAQSGAGLAAVVDDLTPQLGSNLDLNSSDITGVGNLNITGNISLSGTVDGRDVASDGTKLDGIETAATADQSDAEIETAYNNQVAQVSAGEKTAGTEVAIRRFSPKDIADMAGTHGGGGGGVTTVLRNDYADSTYTQDLDTILTYTIPAGTLGASDWIEVDIYGKMANPSGSPDRPLIFITLGTTNVWADLPGAIAAGDSINFHLQFKIKARGSTSSQLMVGNWEAQNGVISTSAGTGDISTDETNSEGIIQGTSALDMTADQKLFIRTDWTVGANRIIRYSTEIIHKSGT